MKLACDTLFVLMMQECGTFITAYHYSLKKSNGFLQWLSAGLMSMYSMMKLSVGGNGRDKKTLILRSVNRSQGKGMEKVKKQKQSLAQNNRS